MSILPPCPRASIHLLFKESPFCVEGQGPSQPATSKEGGSHGLLILRGGGGYVLSTSDLCNSTGQTYRPQSAPRDRMQEPTLEADSERARGKQPMAKPALDDAQTPRYVPVYVQEHEPIPSEWDASAEGSGGRLPDEAEVCFLLTCTAETEHQQ